MPRFFLLELFSGTSSFARAARAALPPGWHMKHFSLDIEARFKPTRLADILTWNHKQDLARFLRGRRSKDLVFVHASPPCTEYSVAKTVGRRNFKKADRIARRALRIIRSARPDYWTIENPRGFLQTRPFMKPYEHCRHVTSYCKYGRPFRKDTCIWSNLKGLRLPCCRKGSYCRAKRQFGRHRISAQAGTRHSGQRGSGHRENVYPLPRRLVQLLIREALRQHLYS